MDNVGLDWLKKLADDPILTHPIPFQESAFSQLTDLFLANQPNAGEERADRWESKTFLLISLISSPSALCLLPSALCLLPSALCLLPSKEVST